MERKNKEKENKNEKKKKTQFCSSLDPLLSFAIRQIRLRMVDIERET